MAQTCWLGSVGETEGERGCGTGSDGAAEAEAAGAFPLSAAEAASPADAAAATDRRTAAAMAVWTSGVRREPRRRVLWPASWLA